MCYTFLRLRKYWKKIFYECCKKCKNRFYFCFFVQWSLHFIGAAHHSVKTKCPNWMVRWHLDRWQFKQQTTLPLLIRLPLGKWTRLMFVNYFDVSSPNNVVGNVSIQLKLLLWKARAEAKIVTFSKTYLFCHPIKSDNDLEVDWFRFCV